MNDIEAEVIRDHLEQGFSDRPTDQAALLLTARLLSDITIEGVAA